MIIDVIYKIVKLSITIEKIANQTKYEKPNVLSHLHIF